MQFLSWAFMSTLRPNSVWCGPVRLFLNGGLKRATRPTSDQLNDTSAHAVAAKIWTPGAHCVELDGVRGMAILLVTLYRFMKEVDADAHPILAFASRCAPLGERGVDLFFVLSGFLITGILLHTKSRDGYFRNFFVRRSLRIFPLYFSALAVCVWLIPTLLSLSAFEVPRAQQGYLWTYMTNVRMSWLNEWCFGPLDHFWSLAVEEHFYLIWPLVVFWLSPKSLLRLSVALIVLVGAARTVAATRPEFDVAVDVLTVFRLDGLCFGAALAVIMRRGVPARWIESVAKWTLPGMLAIALVVAVLGKRLLGVPNSLCPAIWTVLLGLLLTRPVGHWMSQIVRVDFLRWLGKYSYGMYVVQLPLLSILTPSLVKDSLSTFTNNRLMVNIAFVPIMFSLTMLLGFLTFHLLEKHFLKLKRAWE